MALTAVLSLHLLPNKVTLSAGDVSTQEVRAVRTVSYLDSEATESLRAAAAARVDAIYTPVPYASPEADETVGEVFAHLRRARLLDNQNAARMAAELRQDVGLNLAPALLEPVMRDATDVYRLDQAETLARQIVHAEMARPIRADFVQDLQETQANAKHQIAAAHLSPLYTPLVQAITLAALRPNQMPDRMKTAAARDAEQRLVLPQYGRIFAGDVVVRRGEMATPTTIEKLRALGLQNPRLDPVIILCVLCLTTVMVTIMAMSLMRFHSRVYRSTKSLALLSLLSLFSVVGMKIGSSMMGVRLSEAQFGYVGMLCLSSLGMMVAALINPRVAMLLITLLIALSSLILGQDLRFAVTTLLSSIVGLYSVSNLRSRNDVVKAFAILIATNVALAMLIGRLENDLWTDTHQALIYAALSGFFAVAVFWLSAPLFERVFGITTHLGLLELSDPNRPLLKQLSETAPGTYHHSLMVGNLAVAAAEAIGADALLCRVGAYYHDLGKMRRPDFFIENQLGRENAHERLTPSLSALVVVAHVRDGLEISEREHLPPVVKAFISEHHGTSLIRYFYHQQVHDGHTENAPGLESQFRYDGPKPQSRETGILMLADGVEAASRTLEKPTLGRIADLVDQIIATQLTDGQLDECDLTLRDLRGIRESFLRLLTGMLHSRVSYPETLKDDVLKPKTLNTGMPTTEYLKSASLSLVTTSHEPDDLPGERLVFRAGTDDES